MPVGCLLQRNVCLDLLPIFQLGCLFFLLLTCMNCLCILEIRPLSVASGQRSPILFIFLVVSFAVQKLLSLIRSRWFICVFIVIILGGGSNKMLL